MRFCTKDCCIISIRKCSLALYLYKYQQTGSTDQASVCKVQMAVARTEHQVGAFKGPVVVLADMDKAEMDAAVAKGLQGCKMEVQTSWLAHSLIYSLAGSLAHSLTCLLAYSLARSPICSLARSPTHPPARSPPSPTHPPTRPLARSLARLLPPSPTHPPTHPLARSLPHPPTHPRAHPLARSLPHPPTHPPTRPPTICPHLGSCQVCKVLRSSLDEAHAFRSRQHVSMCSQG